MPLAPAGVEEYYRWVQPTDTAFNESIATNYERWMVPIYFQPYAERCAEMARPWNPAQVLEVGAGTGALTRELSRVLPQAQILATDLNPAMIEVARSRAPAGSSVRWEAADVLVLPVPSESMDLVVCQFAVMFFPDRPAAYAEMARVLAPGGHLLFTTWGPIESLPVDLVAEKALGALFSSDPPTFIRRVPHGYHDRQIIRDELGANGFRSCDVELLEVSVQVETARELALALCTGTPIRAEIEGRDPAGIRAAVDHVEAAIMAEFGPAPITHRMSALAVTAVK